MHDLRLWMLMFGVLIGVVFPFALIPLGVPASTSLTPLFFAATVVAGLLVATVNYALTAKVVGSRLHLLATSMQHVEESLQSAAYSNDWSSCNPRDCMVPVDSEDEFGEAASSFNRLVESLAMSNQLAEGMTAMSEALASNLELNGLADATIRELASRTGYEAAALLVVDGGQVQVAGSYGIRNAAALVESEAVGTVLRTERASIIDVPEGVEISGGLVDIRPREVRMLPVRHGVLVLGVLVVAAVHPSTRDDLAVLDSALPGLAVALNNSLNHERLQRVAALDPLTGIYNRRFGLQRLQEEFKRSVRSGDPLGLLMLDIDHFKAVNDTYGHLVGDRVLQSVVTAARQTLREGDILTRYGGEEFVAALPGANRSDVLMMAEAIRHAVADSVTADAGRQISVTISVGGAALPNSAAENPEALIDLADQALYSAKSAGRDRSVVV